MQEDVEDLEYDDADGTDKWVQYDRCLKWYHQYCGVLELGETTNYIICSFSIFCNFHSN